MSIKLKTAEKISHPALMEACSKKAPAGYRPIRQFVRRTIQNGVRSVKTETGLVDVVAIPGHFELEFRRNDRRISWYNHGCLVFARGESKPAQVTKQVRRLVYDAQTKQTVMAIKDFNRECASCGDSPVVVQTGMCAVCTWGESNW
jgi:hypothetical protein